MGGIWFRWSIDIITSFEKMNLTFENTIAGSGKYVKISVDGGETCKTLPCGRFELSLQGNGRFELRHRQLFTQLNFSRTDVSLPVSTDDLDLHAKLSEIFACCNCAGSDCEQECWQPPGLRRFYFDFLECNPLNETSTVLLGVGMGAPCDSSCQNMFEDQTFIVTSAQDFCNQILDYLGSNPYPGFATGWTLEPEPGMVRLVILDNYPTNDNCCNEEVFLYYTLEENTTCDEGVFAPDCFQRSNPADACCSGPAPCDLGIQPGNSVFSFTFNIVTGAYNPQNLTIQTQEGDCFGVFLGSAPAAVYDSETIATYYYNALVALIGTFGVYAVTQPDAQSVRVELDGTACCTNNILLVSTNGTWNSVINNPSLVLINPISCCP